MQERLMILFFFAILAYSSAPIEKEDCALALLLICSRQRREYYIISPVHPTQINPMSIPESYNPSGNSTADEYLVEREQ